LRIDMIAAFVGSNPAVREGMARYDIHT
jgi:hypothetical protein